MFSMDYYYVENNFKAKKERKKYLHCKELYVLSIWKKSTFHFSSKPRVVTQATEMENRLRNVFQV